MDAQVKLDGYWTTMPRQWAYFTAIGTLLLIIFWDGIDFMVKWWLNREEYSHGILIPFITLFLIWQKKNELARLPFSGSWLGIAVLLVGLITFFLGELSALYTLLQYGFVIALIGAIWAICGLKQFQLISIPIFLLFLAIPLPNFIYRGLSGELQLISSKLGVDFIRAFNISVFLEGNVIDLGSMQLQVVEACNGLRYLFPLVSLAFMCAYFYQAALWKRAIVFFSSIPITVLMNSFRIGIIGVTSEYWGKAMAEGFLHDFEGWFIFMACAAVLLGEMWLLAQIGGQRRPLAEVFGLTIPAPIPSDAQRKPRNLPKQWPAVTLLLTLTAGLSLALQHREELVPNRAEFLDFPLKVENWTGRRQTMEQKYIDALKFEDYILADYSREGDPTPVNFYSAYYASQRKGESIHSPRSCIPGGGWQIASLQQKRIESLSTESSPFQVNRLIIKKGEESQLVYYWFQQRGRALTNEYLVKWYLFQDAITKNRTDGALVRLTTFVGPHESLEISDERLTRFLTTIRPELKRYIID